jgi:hypothetical protein
MNTAIKQQLKNHGGLAPPQALQALFLHPRQGRARSTLAALEHTTPQLKQSIYTTDISDDVKKNSSCCVLAQRFTASARGSVR